MTTGPCTGVRLASAIGCAWAVAAGTPTLAAETAPVPQVLGTCEGQDWSLSAKVRPLPRTGLFTMDGKSRHKIVRHRGHTLTWAELNPAPGVYDWKPIEKVLMRAERGNHGVVLRLKASVVERRSPFGPLRAVPDWVLETFDPPIARTRDRGRGEFIDVVVPWDERVQAAYLDFVRAFGEQQFHRHRRLLGLYVHGISSSWGEEFWLDEGAVAALAPYGLSPERLRAAFEARIAAWADAFGDEAGRLGWVGTGWIAAGDDWRAYRDMGDRIDAFALEQGLGQRWGHNESYNRRFDQSGQELGEDGRLHTDPAHPMIAEARYWGGENEVWKGSPAEAFDYRRATLRALQMEMRQLWVNDKGISLDPEIVRYFTQVAGRQPGEAPDAWSLLRETEVRIGSKRRRVGNLERWLYMVTEPGGEAPERVRPVSRARQSKDWGEPREWTARAVSAEAGGKLFFELDERFMEGGPGGPDVIVQVTWIDDGARWHLEAGNGGALVAAPGVTGRADGREKTTDVRVARFAQSPAGPDLAVVADGGTLAVTRVRVLRRADAGRSCTKAIGSEGAHG